MKVEAKTARHVRPRVDHQANIWARIAEALGEASGGTKERGVVRRVVAEHDPAHARGDGLRCQFADALGGLCVRPLASARREPVGDEEQARKVTHGPSSMRPSSGVLASA